MASEVFAYKHLTESGVVKTGPGVLHSVLLSAAGADATATVYDEIGGSGDVLAVVTSVQDASECVVLDVAFGVGCYVGLSGTGAKVTVSYK
jgi:hypothetical protein